MKFTNALLIAASLALALPSEAEVSSAALTGALSSVDSPVEIADVHRELRKLEEEEEADVDPEEEEAAKEAAAEAVAAEEACHQTEGKTKKQIRRERRAERKARTKAKKALKKLRKAEKKLKKKRRKNRKKEKKEEKDTAIIGGQCVADHVCASIRGDPHITTFDGLKYDCQGHGEFVLAKSMQTAFEIQGRFEMTGRDDKSVSITKGLSIDTGVEGAPTFDVFAEEVEGVCLLNYYANGNLTDFGTDGLAVPGIEFMEDVETGKEIVDFVYFTGSGVMYTVLVKKGSWGCVMNSKICLPPKMVEEEDIIGLLGSPNGEAADDWMSAFGSDLHHNDDTGLESSYGYCTAEWCVHNEDESIFAYQGNMGWSDYYGCADSYDSSAEDAIATASEECKTCCGALAGLEYAACLLECVEGTTEDCEIEIVVEEGLEDVERMCPDTAPVPTPSPGPEANERSGFAPPKKGSGSGDPHFKTWTGEKYDYHGECDLVLLDDPSFNDGQGLRVHIRTTRVKYFSYIEKAAIQIGDDVLEFDNDVENFLINGEKVEANNKHHKTLLGGYVVRRDPKAISIRLQDDKTAEARRAGKVAKIDLHTRKNGFPAVIIDGGKTDIFQGSLGLLGDWATGRKLARDGETEVEVDEVNAEAFALEWQVRDTDPMLFKDARFPQWPTTCTPPATMVKSRIGMEKARKEAEEACAHWAHDKDDCIFDVMATRDVLVAEEGHIVHLE